MRLRRTFRQAAAERNGTGDRPFAGLNTERSRTTGSCGFTPDGKGSVGGDFCFGSRADGRLRAEDRAGGSGPEIYCLLSRFPFRRRWADGFDGRRVGVSRRGRLCVWAYEVFFGPAARCLSFAGSVAVLREPDRRFCFGASDSGKLRGSEDGRGLSGSDSGFRAMGGAPGPWRALAGGSGCAGPERLVSVYPSCVSGGDLSPDRGRDSVRDP